MIDRLSQPMRRARVCGLAPRGSGKSELMTLAYPIYNVVHKREPYQVIASDTFGQAEKLLRGISREFETNERLRRDFGELCEPGDTWRKDYLEFRSGYAIDAVGQDSSIRGTKTAGGQRPTLILIDDPEGKKHKISSAKRDRSWDWLMSDLIPLGGPDGDINVFMVGTAICPGCLVLRVENEAGWEHQIFPAVDPMPDRMDLWNEWKTILCNFAVPMEEREETALEFYESHRAEMDDGAGVLWPEMYSLYDKMLTWAKDLGAFNTEDQGIPYDPSSTYFDPSYLEGSDLWFDDWPEETRRLLVLDPALGRTKYGDYQALVAWGRDANGQEYVDCWCNREDIPKMAERCVATAMWFMPLELCVETIAFQALLLDDVKRAADRLGIRHSVKLKGIYSHPNDTKEARIERLSSPLWQRRIKFKRNSPGVAMLLQQMRQYPFDTKRDAPDALGMARDRAKQLWGEQ